MGYPTVTWDSTGPGLGRVFQVLDTISFEMGWDEFPMGYPICQALAGISRGMM